MKVLEIAETLGTCFFDIREHDAGGFEVIHSSWAANYRLSGYTLSTKTLCYLLYSQRTNSSWNCFQERKWSSDDGHFPSLDLHSSTEGRTQAFSLGP